MSHVHWKNKNIRIGPVDLTEGTADWPLREILYLYHLSGTTDDGGPVPTVTDNAFSLGLIPNKQVGISFEPTSSLSVVNGELTFGGVDTSRYTGDLHTV